MLSLVALANGLLRQLSAEIRASIQVCKAFSLAFEGLSNAIVLILTSWLRRLDNRRLGG